MKETAKIIPGIRDGLALDLPAILAGRGAADFDSYSIGYPTDQQKSFCCVRFNSSGKQGGKKSFTFTVHLQLPGVDEGTAYKYMDAAEEYLSGFDTGAHGYEYGEYAIEFIENFRVADNQIFFDYTMTGVLGDCDYE